MSTTRTRTLLLALNEANLQDIADALRAVQLGTVLSPRKHTVVGLTAAAAIDITSLGVAAAATPGPDQAGGTLPPILSVTTLRVTASGTGASVGAYGTTDAGGTPIVPPGGANAALGIATISDDGKTLTFPNTITGFVITYIPRSAQDVTTKFPPGSVG